MTNDTVSRIQQLADSVRHDILLLTLNAGVNGGHIGGALSSADILAVLYGEVLRISSKEPEHPLRDRFLLSKGHIALAHYAVLAECGFISKEDMLTFEESGSEFPTHAVMNQQKGIEISGGSLGYGLSIGVGCALAAKKKGENYRTFVLLGDGECNEGTVWEAAMSAAKFKLDNLTVIIDVNEQQLDGYTANIMPIYNLPMVFEGFGFHVIEVDGNDIEQLLNAFNEVIENSPKVIIAHTIKSKGVKSIEGQEGWHHARITKEQYDMFVKDLEGGK